MIETIAQLLRPILMFSIIRRVRRNHALEHATIHMLSRRVKKLRIAGRADNSGFYLYGEVDTELVESAAQEALDRMKRGESQWAVHPNCGTNLVTTSLMTSVAAIVGLSGQKDDNQSFSRLPLVMIFTLVALVLSQPVGMSVQKHITTEGTPGDLTLKNVTRHNSKTPFGNQITIHRINTQKG